MRTHGCRVSMPGRVVRAFATLLVGALAMSTGACSAARGGRAASGSAPMVVTTPGSSDALSTGAVVSSATSAARSSASSTARSSASSAARSSASSAARSSPSAAPSPSHKQPEPARARFVFPVSGNVYYAHDVHHDYPATDIIAACGLTVRAVTDAVVLEVNRVDRYDPATNLGPDRGGLFVSIRGDDGVRYYGSHFSSIETWVTPGARLVAGQPIGKIGATGDAGACHLHFGISPVCKGTGQWWIRRGVIWPSDYLDAWRRGVSRSAANEIARWQAAHGCPTLAASRAS